MQTRRVEPTVEDGGGLEAILGHLGLHLGRLWRSWGGLGTVLGGLVAAWGRKVNETSYGHFLEAILSLRPGVHMKGFFITFGLSREGSGGHWRSAT